MEEFELLVAEEYKFEDDRNKKSKTFWKLRTVKTLIQGTQIDNSPIEKLSTTRELSMPTLIQEIKPAVLVKYEFEYREKPKLKRFLGNFGTIRLLMQGKTMIL